MKSKLPKMPHNGHNRRYKNGKTIFIQPYWKGPLKDIKIPEPIKAKLEIK